MSTTYKSAGVDIEAGDQFVKRIKSHVKSTFNKNVLTDIGLFGSFYEIDFTKYDKPVLVSSVDGVGTKLKVAIMTNKHDTIGQDLVNHCVNDIAVCGAEPLYFMDYLAFGKLNPEKAEKIIDGFATACRENGVALVGGETAEMPDMYAEEDYDVSGTIVGIVEKEKIIDGRNVKAGDVLIGFKSSGLHTNGYSLARKVLFNKFQHNSFIDELGCTIGEELLKVHKSYLPLIRELKSKFEIKAFSHITGGGIIGNTRRVVQENLKLKIDWDAWNTPPVFELIQKTGSVPVEDMRSTFNLGIGLVAVVSPETGDKILSDNELKENGILIGEVTA